MSAAVSKSVAIETLVELSTCVALSPPERSQDRERARSLNGRGELPRTRGVQGKRDHVGSPDGCDELGDCHHLDQLDGSPENPLEFGDAGSTAMLQRERPKTHDDCHRRSFCATRPSSGVDRAGGNIDHAPSA